MKARSGILLAVALGLSVAPNCGAQCSPAWTPGFGVPGVDQDYWAGGAIGSLLVSDRTNPPTIYVGGSFTIAGQVRANGAARWDGRAWSAMNIPSGGFASSLIEFDDGSGPSLYAAGNLDGAGLRVARWDGQAWQSLRSQPPGLVSDLEVFDDGRGAKLYASNGESYAETAFVWRWDDPLWTEVGRFYGPLDQTWVGTLEVFDDGTGPALYAGGAFNRVGELQCNFIVRWTGQIWEPVRGRGYVVGKLRALEDESGPALYATGLEQGPGINGAVERWDGISWTLLSGGLEHMDAAADVAMLETQGVRTLYAAVRFGLGAPGGREYPLARWTGTEWVPVPTLHPMYSRAAYTLATAYEGGREVLYAGGTLMLAGDLAGYGILRWDGERFSRLGDGRGLSDMAWAFAAIPSELGGGVVVGGPFEAAGGTLVKGLGRLGPNGWEPFLPFDADNTVEILALLVYDDGSGSSLFAAGRFERIGGVPANNIARWDGQRWRALGDGVTTGQNVMAATMAVFDDGDGPKLYVGGQFARAGNREVNNIARWDGSNWEPVGNGLYGAPRNSLPYVVTLLPHDDGRGRSLFAAGSFTHADGAQVNGVARWDGQAWSGVGGGVAGWYLSYIVECMAEYDSGDGPQLYIGGEFARAGGRACQNIARWDGTSWFPVGSGATGGVYGMAVFDDGTGPQLYAGANSTFPDVLYGSVARWNGVRWSPTSERVLGTAGGLTVLDEPGGPALWFGGSFVTVGDMPSVRIARFGCLDTGVRGDMNCDGRVNFFDVDGFVTALIDPDAYFETFRGCERMNADCDGNGRVDNFDIDPFVALLIGAP